jgi:hypothetical protein
MGELYSLVQEKCRSELFGWVFYLKGLAGERFWRWHYCVSGYFIQRVYYLLNISFCMYSVYVSNWIEIYNEREVLNQN